MLMSNNRFVIAQELRQLVGLAGPLVFTQLAQMGMGVVDTVMAGRLGAVNLAGVALGGVVFWPLLLLVAGIVMSLTPTVSQLHGSGRSREAGEAVRQVLWIALGAGMLLILVLQNIAPLYGVIGVDPEAVPINAGLPISDQLGRVAGSRVLCIALFVRRDVLDRSGDGDLRRRIVVKNPAQLLVYLWWLGPARLGRCRLWLGVCCGYGVSIPSHLLCRKVFPCSGGWGLC